MGFLIETPNITLQRTRQDGSGFVERRDESGFVWVYQRRAAELSR